MSKNLRALFRFTLSTKGLSVTELAEAHMMSTSNLCNAFYIPYPKGEAIIAAVLNQKPQDFWPDRYGPDGRPNRRNAWYDRGRVKDKQKK